MADPGHRARPLHLRPSVVLLVVLGGAAGTVARELLSLAIPDVAAFPVAVFVGNLVGAFVLGLLLEALARSGPDEGIRQRLRLLVGTGFCGGFTTYSSLATASAVFILAGEVWKAVLYGVVSVVLGFVCSFAGIAVATIARRERDR
ncbi:fluoride efflux transporter FluC [Amnibacterium sp.]|uniref:fluoride efflux transporter FluC n=1 Tax=Amnibacterium sp. TaxID=1872496 RepID=UPI003F7BB8EF